MRQALLVGEIGTTKGSSRDWNPDQLLAMARDLVFAMVGLASMSYLTLLSFALVAHNSMDLRRSYLMLLS